MRLHASGKEITMVMELTPVRYEDDDVEWMRQAIRLVADGGFWLVPCNETVIQFSHGTKEYELLEGDPNDQTNRITIAILENELGYKRKESE
jgi:hypothetical protein